MRDGEPYSESKGHVDAGGFYLTHAIWHNSYGSYQPETGVRTHANGLRDFRLIQHMCDDWQLVTDVLLAGLRKGRGDDKLVDVIVWLHSRKRRLARESQ